MAEAWSLCRSDGPHDWSLTNTSGKVARQVYVRFEGTVDGRRWWEGVVPASGLARVARFQPDETVWIDVDRSDTVDQVSVRWKSGLCTKTWSTEDP
ncbi:MAG: hypothetical protein GEV10_03325 [Streptosporangiales bacterium]|nr:hypothetical protein [Streptosporangiales bacterium]